MAGLVERMVRASRLEPALYEEVEADPSAMGQAMTVVVLSSVAAGIGAWGEGGMGAAVLGVVAALVGWVIWAFLTYLIGTKMLPGPNTKSNPSELLRTIGFASAPGVLRALSGIPGIGGVIAVVVSVWMLVAMVIAVRSALDYEGTGRAVLVCVIGWAVQLGVIVGFALLLGGAAFLAGKS